MDPPLTAGTWIEQDNGPLVRLAGNCMFGRSRSNTIVVESHKASRHHATIHAQDESEFWLIDLGSINGTYLNGTRVVRPERLKDGDRLLIADTTFNFRQTVPQCDPSVGESIATVADVRSEDRWLMLADIEGFTPLSQRLSATELATIVGSWVLSGREIIGRNGGTINKYMGDGYLVCWPSQPEAPAKITAAIRDFEALRHTSEPKFRIIVHHGIVSYGGVAAGYGEESLMGADVNFIFRAEKIASKLGIAFCFTVQAAALLVGHLQLEAIPGEHELKGFAGSSKFLRLSRRK